MKMKLDSDLNKDPEEPTWFLLSYVFKLQSTFKVFEFKTQLKYGKKLKVNFM